MDKKKGKRNFGTGLDAILDISTLSNSNLTENQFSGTIRPISLDSLVPCRYQPRKVFNQETLQELSQSIAKHGILQPIVVRKDNDCYEIIAGERRWRASKLAGKETIPAVICDVDDKSVMAFSLIENIQRDNLDPIEEAEAIKKLIDSHHITHEAVSKIIGKSRSRVTNMLRLLGLSGEIKNLLQNRQLDMGHARAILALPDYKQAEVAKRIVEKKMSVRQTEAYINSLLKDKKTKNITISDNLIEDCHKVETSLKNTASFLDSKIKPKVGGKVELSIIFASLEELEAFIEKEKIPSE